MEFRLGGVVVGFVYIERELVWYLVDKVERGVEGRKFSFVYYIRGKV